MISASGCCFLALDTGRIMLQQRSKTSSHPLTWSFWGGKSEKKERPIETLLRECNEEMGILPDIKKYIHYILFLVMIKNLHIIHSALQYLKSLFLYAMVKVVGMHG